MSRPPNLPEFRRPPLNEVVLGVQFDLPGGYQQIRAGEVWKLFAGDFPTVQELPPLSPSFETFGMPQVQQMPFGLISGAMHDRFWFVSGSGDEIIQFQNDRLMHNWRKVGDQINKYPRYECIVKKFFSELRIIEEYFSSLQQQKLAIRQCEISYINHIWALPGTGLRAVDWLAFLSFPGIEPDDFVTTFRRTIVSGDDQPKGRLMCECATAIEPGGRKFISLTLTARGAPDRPDSEAALEFLGKGREMIVRTFAEITTDSAHGAWERTQ